MPEYRTTTLGQFGHPEMVANVSQEYYGSLKGFFSILENCVKNGDVYKPGQTVQLGWMVTKLFARHDGAIEFCEPNLEEMPIKWCLGLNRTLRDLMIQHEVCSVLDLEPVFPTILDVGLLSAALIDGRDEFLMSREVTSEKDCGWAFLELDYTELSVSYCSLFEIALARPMIIPFLAIPPNCRVDFGKEGFVISLDSRRISKYTDKFLQELWSSVYFRSYHRLN